MSDQITDFQIPNKTQNIVVFVHGFGVRWDSRGMFTEIRDHLPTDWGNVLFDFYSTEEEHVFIPSITNQVKRLQEVVKKVSTENPHAAIHLVAHSMGCIVTALAKPKVTGAVLFLAPPEKFSGRMKEYFSKYPGAKEVDEELVVPRRDGTVTHIPLQFFKETANINVERSLLEFSQEHHINLLHTTNDEVLKEVFYTALQSVDSITITEMPADHNFTGEYRKKLINYIKPTL